jgi:hypothetical protein
MNETWKDIPDYEGLYQASNLGEIRNIKFGRKRKVKPVIDAYGYYRLTLCKENKKKNFNVHRLVWEAFNGKTDLTIDHIVEGNKLDNRLCNLQAMDAVANSNKYYLSKGKTSKHIGVSFTKQKNCWVAYADVNRKRISLGLHKTEEEAHNAVINYKTKQHVSTTKG